jgi:hypothetical protein
MNKRKYETSSVSSPDTSADSDDSESETSRPMKKQKFNFDKKLTNVINASLTKGKLYISFATANLQPQDLIELYDEFTKSEHEFEFIDPNLVRLNLSDEQKKANKRDYRNEYNARASTIALKEKNKNDPEKKKKRAEYSARPDVKERKSLKNKAKRAFINECEAGKIINYSDYMEAIVPPIQKASKEESKKKTLKSTKIITKPRRQRTVIPDTTNPNAPQLPQTLVIAEKPVKKVIQV